VTAIPQAAEVGVGQLIPVEIRIANAANVASVPFHLKFDPAVLRLNTAPAASAAPSSGREGTSRSSS